jgi:DNA-binding IclR family transcriptional regulator
VLVERLSARGARRVLYRIGGRMPMHSTSVGLVLLAHAPVAVQDELLAGDLTGQPDGDLRALLAAIRRDGVAAVSRTSPEAVTSVAAPVLRNRQAVVGQSDQLRPTALAPAVVAVARAVSRAVSQLQP